MASDNGSSYANIYFDKFQNMHIYPETANDSFITQDMLTY